MLSAARPHDADRDDYDNPVGHDHDDSHLPAHPARRLGLGEVRGVMLHFGGAQELVGILFAVLAAVLAVIFTVVALQSRADVPFTRVQAVGYWIRRRWLGLLAALLVVVVGSSLATLPYASGSTPARVPVTVTAGQFYWSIRPAQLPARTPIRFDVTSVDVNHGFGIYDPGGHLVGSVQAMPGYHNHLDLTLDTPGRYQVMCLEFCGVSHHRMDAGFTVTGS